MTIAAAWEGAIIIACSRINNCVALLSYFMIWYAISTYLVRLAVRAAAVPVDPVAVVAYLPFFYTDNAITTATDIDADSLVGGTDLPGPAAETVCSA
jgi:hypothetical protein